MNRVLVVDDDEPLRQALGAHLRARGYDVDLAGTGEAALRYAAGRPHDLAIVDLGLPGIPGIDVVRGLRGWTPVPIIVLSARHEEREKIGALDAGADDYITKPFAMGELLARVRAALRRTRRDDRPPVVETSDFRIDLATRRVTKPGGEEVHLTPTQWHLVEILVLNPERLVSQRQLLQDVWGPGFVDHANYLRGFMAQIRQKFEPDPSRPRYFITEPGIGIRFVPAPPPSAD